MLAIMGTISDDVREIATAQAATRGAVLAVGHDYFEDPDLIERIVAIAPASASTLFDVRIVVTECVANIVMHGSCAALIVSADVNQRGLELQFTHIPPLPAVVHEVIERSRTEALPDLNDPFYFGTGLGYPLMTRLCKNIRLSSDNACLEFSFATAS